MIYWSKIISLIIFTFIILNLFYIYNFVLYPEFIQRNIYLLRFNDNKCTEQPLIICKSAKFPDIIIQTNIAIFGAEITNFVTLIFRFVIFCTKDLSNKYYKEHKTELQFHYNVYQIMVSLYYKL